jgi:hypothetical protein
MLTAGENFEYPQHVPLITLPPEKRRKFVPQLSTTNPTTYNRSKTHYLSTSKKTTYPHNEQTMEYPTKTTVNNLTQSVDNDKTTSFATPTPKTFPHNHTPNSNTLFR